MSEQLVALAGKIKGWQAERKLSNSEMLRKFPGLGSDKTYGRIVEGDLEELDTERWAREYAAVWSLIELLSESEGDDDPIYDDLTTVIELRKAMADAIREKGNNRLIIVQGPSGAGKTTAARLLAAKYGARVIFCEATEIWKENANAMLSGILREFGVNAPPISVAEKLQTLVEKLNESRRCLVIDEGHHLGPRSLNLVKTLINQTPGEVIILAMGTLWTRLETQAYAEARQLTQNRLSERLRFDSVQEADVRRILERRLGLDGDVLAAAKALTQHARNAGGLAFVKLVCRKARKLAGKDATVTGDHLARALSQVQGTR